MFWRIADSHSTAGDALFKASRIERFSIECRKTKTKTISYQLDFSANLKRVGGSPRGGYFQKS